MCVGCPIEHHLFFSAVAKALIRQVDLEVAGSIRSGLLAKTMDGPEIPALSEAVRSILISKYPSGNRLSHLDRL